MSYQFVHLETFSRKPDSSGRSTAFVFDEADRRPEACQHVAEPLAPVVVYGATLDEVRRLHDTGAVAAMTEAAGRAKRIRTDQHTLVTVVASFPKAAGCEVVREEKATGTTTAGRTELATILDFIRAGDVLVVTRIDRLARSIADLQTIVRTLRERGAALQATEQPVDTSTAAGKAFVDMLGVFAEFETNLRRERQLEGIAKAKAEGVYKGRKSTIDADEVRRLRTNGMGASAIAKALGIGRASVYRLLDEASV